MRLLDDTRDWGEFFDAQCENHIGWANAYKRVHGTETIQNLNSAVNYLRSSILEKITVIKKRHC